jgi:hypothetical protein
MRSAITAHSVANSVRMKRSQFAGAFIIVEGPTDKRVYELITDRSRCRIEIAYGKENVLEAVSILNAMPFAGIAAIVDADFCNITGEAPEAANVFCTDLHDLECMMLNSPATDRLLGEYITEERLADLKSEHPDVAGWLAEVVMPVGCLRLISARRNLNLKFKDLRFSKFLVDNGIEIDIGQLVRVTIDHSQAHSNSAEELIDQVTKEMAEMHDRWQLCSGHDIIAALGIAMRKILTGKNAGDVSPEKPRTQSAARVRSATSAAIRPKPTA